MAKKPGPNDPIDPTHVKQEVYHLLSKASTIAVRQATRNRDMRAYKAVVRLIEDYEKIRRT